MSFLLFNAKTGVEVSEFKNSMNINLLYQGFDGQLSHSSKGCDTENEVGICGLPRHPGIQPKSTKELTRDLNRLG